MKRRIDGREIIRDLAAGMTGEALRKKYDLSAEQLHAARKQFREIRMRRVTAIHDDIQLGMSNAQLMEKYQLSPAGLSKAMREFIRLQGGEAEGGRASHIPNNGGKKTVDLRKALRNFPNVVVSVCEAGGTGTPCQLNDITEAGVGISGIAANIGEIKTIVVLGDELGQVAPFEFQAECRWTGMEVLDGVPRAGFRITKISDEDFELLKEFIGQYTFAIESA